MRRFLPFLAVLMLAGGLIIPVHAVTSADSAKATAIVSGLDDAILSIMKDGKSLGYQGRFDRMAPVVDKTFDLGFMTKFLVGAKWKDLTEDQHKALTASFRTYTIGQYANRFTDYDGETIKIMGDPTDQRDNIRIQTQLLPRTGQPVKLDYILQHNDNGLQVIDVFLQGTISELATERSQFQSVLASSGVDGLIAMLDKKAGDASITGGTQGGANGSGSVQKQ